MAEKKIILSYDEKQGEGNYYYYVDFKEKLIDKKAGESVKQVTYDGFESDDVQKEKIELIVDFDKDDKIVGIEIISNRDIIPQTLK